MKKLKIVFWGILIIIAITIIGVFVYEKVTVDEEYSIDEKNLYIPIFVYHDIVADNSEIKLDYMQTSKETFEKQIKGLKDYGYNFITYNDLKNYKNKKIKLKKHSCILTFDDGLEGVYKNAYPVAQKYDIPFTMFVITNNIGQEGVITWEQAKEMQDSDLVTIASHSINHPDFSELSVQEAVDNVNVSYEIIERELGKQANRIFTYPYGLYKDEQINELEKQNYIQNLTDNKINKSKDLNLSKLHRCYPLSDSINIMLLKIWYRSLKYGD